jgi:hypothetical protein
MAEHLEALLQWIERHPGLAAWVQAIGIGAIIAVLLVAHFQQRTAARAAYRDRLRKARGLALMLQPELIAFEGTLERLSLLPPSSHKESAKPPQTILDLADQLHLLGDAGGCILQMIGALNAHARLEAASAGLADELEHAELDRLRSARLSRARRDCTEAVRGLRRITERPDR